MSSFCPQDPVVCHNIVLSPQFFNICPISWGQALSEHGELGQSGCFCLNLPGVVHGQTMERPRDRQLGVDGGWWLHLVLSGSLRQKQEWVASLECGVGGSLSLWASHLCPPSAWLAQRDPVPSPRPCPSALSIGMSHTLIYNVNPFYHSFPSISPSFPPSLLLSLPSFFHFFLPSSGPLFLPLKDHLLIPTKPGTVGI